MKYYSLAVDFKREFISVLKSTSVERLNLAWSSQTERTAFYYEILRPISHNLGLKLITEFLRVDFCLNSSIDIPLIVIESENIVSSANHEVEKLCSLAAPVKVLLLCCSWADYERAKWFDGWRKRIKDHHVEIQRYGIYLFIVAEWGRKQPIYDESLRYYIEEVGSDGALIGSEEFKLTED